jgi:DNA-binding transcriptional ArsR family regulator
MSWEALSWVWPREITPPARKLIAVALADSASEDGVCWPSHQHLASRVSMSPETVRQHLRELEAAGVIERSRRAREDGSQTSNEYRVTPWSEPTGGGGGSSPPVGGGSPPGETEPSAEPSTEPGAQGALLPDPVEEVWEHYTKTLDRPKAQLTPKVRRWIADAIKAVGVDESKRAIDGLAASEYHRSNGYVGIEYALRPKQGQTVESRVAFMASKAGAAISEVTTVAALLATVPSDRHVVVHSHVDRVLAMQRSDREHVVRAGQESLVWLREHPPYIEPVFENNRLRGWRKVR